MVTRPPSIVTSPGSGAVEEYGRAPEFGRASDLPGDREVRCQRGQASGDVGRRPEFDTGGDGLDGSGSGRVEADDGAGEIDASAEPAVDLHGSAGCLEAAVDAPGHGDQCPGGTHLSR